MPETAQEDSPLTSEERLKMEDSVIASARRHLVGRRVVDVYGPLGAGVQGLPSEEFEETVPGVVDLLGSADAAALVPRSRTFKPIPVLYKDFVLHWRDLEASRAGAFPLDVSAAAGAAALVAQAEDRLVFFGRPELGYQGLLTVPGRTQVAGASWERAGGGFDNVVAALEALLQKGYPGPYAMVVSPRRFAQLHRVYERTGVLEMDSVRKVVTEGIFQSTALGAEQAVVVATGSEHVDLAVAVDISLRYLGAEQMNHPFRVLECVALRIKHADAVCTLDLGVPG